MVGVLNWIWQGSVIALLAAGCLAALDRARPSARYRLCWVSLVLILLVPALGVMFHVDPIREARHPQGASHALVPPPIALPFTIGILPPLALWVLWVLALGGPAAIDLVRIHRVKRTCRAFPVAREARLAHWRARGGRHRARLVVSDIVPAAAVLGVRSPVIAVSPALLARLSDEELDLVLMHEWSHVERKDQIANLVQVLVRVAVGWHPGLWWIDRRLQVEREAACDERTASRTRSRHTYAACLVKLAGLQLAGRRRLPVPAVPSSSRLGDRVARLLREESMPPAKTALAVGFAAAALAVTAVAVGGVRLVGFTAPSRPSAAAVRIEPLSAPAPAASPAGSPPVAPGARATARRTAPVQPRAPAAPPADSAPPPSPLLVAADLPQAFAPGEARMLTMPPAVAIVDAVSVSAAEPPSGSGPGAMPAVDRSGSPWLVFADAGIAVGHGSQEAAVRTARLFTRAGRKIAGAF